MKSRRNAFLLLSLTVLVLLAVLISVKPLDKTEKVTKEAKQAAASKAAPGKELLGYIASCSRESNSHEKSVSGAKAVFDRYLMSPKFEENAFAYFRLVKDNNSIGYAVQDVKTGELVGLAVGESPLQRIEKKLNARNDVEYYYPVYNVIRFEFCTKLVGEKNWAYYNETTDSFIPFKQEIDSLARGREVTR